MLTPSMVSGRTTVVVVVAAVAAADIAIPLVAWAMPCRR
jgi:hypothetical protein